MEVVNIEMVAWMQELPVVNPFFDGAKYLVIGRVLNFDNTLAVSESNGGAGRYYCTLHQAVYKITDRCPYCAGMHVLHDPSG